MSLVKVGSKHQVVIPKGVRASLGVRPGDYVDIAVSREGAFIKPKKIVDRYSDERLGPKARAGLRQALKEVAEGRVSNPLRSAEEVQSWLASIKKKSIKRRDV